MRDAAMPDAAMPDAAMPDAAMPDAAMPDEATPITHKQGQDNGLTAAPWHGIIRHVQSKEEIRFTQIEDALRFVANYVELSASIPTQDDSD
jgi:hypothetical protein